MIKDQFNVYVHVNGTQVISEPGNTALAGPFTLDLQEGDNAVRVRLASKTGAHFAERYSNDRFHYKVITDVLVSNLGKRSLVAPVAFDTGSHFAMQFTTGSNSRGYTVSGVRLPIAIATAAVSPVVSIYSDDSGDPGASIKVLTNPTINVSSTETTEVQFAADDYKLEPGTYWIVVEKPAGSDEIRLEVTVQSEDGGGAPGWSIRNDSKFSTDSGASYSTISARAKVQFAVRGTVGPADATLSALTLKDASDNAVALAPVFASGTTRYYAAVANSVSQIKVEPTPNDSNATIAYLDDGDMTLDDDDTSTADVFDLDLSVGQNVVKVKVTGEDGTTTETYTVSIRRAEADLLVSNLGQAFGQFDTLANTNDAAATQFTTGRETHGYLISKVLVDISTVSGGIPRVSIYSDNSGQPGSSLKVLTNPSPIPTTRTGVDFGADNYKLEPGKPYWIVVEKTSSGGSVLVYSTGSTAEDTGAAAGWSIGDNGSFTTTGTTSTGTWSSSANVIIYRIAVKGTVAPPAVSDDATLSDLALRDASDNAVALDPTFASDTTSYNATVANSVSRIKVEPTANDSNADIEYLDDGDATLTDEDTSTAVFDFDLDVGPNVVKVKVTAEDNSTTETYQVTITREATTPGAPASLTATGGTAEATLTWTAPASDGERPSPSTSTGSAPTAGPTGPRTGPTCPTAPTPALTRGMSGR